METTTATAPHIVVTVARDGFGPFHYNPNNGRDWTPESAADYVRRCQGGSGRSGGGCAAAVETCTCDWQG